MWVYDAFTVQTNREHKTEASMFEFGLNTRKEQGSHDPALKSFTSVRIKYFPVKKSVIIIS